MKNIIVSAASLRMGGAVTIYNQFITHLREEIGDNRYFIFVNKVLEQPEITGVRYYVIDIEARKKRTWFDNKGCKEILEKECFDPDAVVSLQNTGVKCLNYLPQLIYYHQPLPFFKKDWNPIKREERSKFLYKHFYLWFVKRSIGPKSKFVVQTRFIKENLAKKIGINESRVTICFPDVKIPDIDNINGYSFPQNEIPLVFPSLYSPHKSYSVLVKAMALLKKQTPQLLNNVRVYITVDKEEAPELVKLIRKNRVEDLFCFMGKLPYEITLSLYKTAKALLFPSTIETLGLPLIEAAAFGLPVLAADVDYAHEVLEDYEGVFFAKADDEVSWSDGIKNVLENKVKHYTPFSIKGKAGWHDFFELI